MVDVDISGITRRISGSVISHITLRTNNRERSERFYDAVLGAIGFSRLPKRPEKPLAYERDGKMPTIYIYTPEDGRPATWATARMLPSLPRREIRFTRSITMRLN
jgi:catechol 2,3-dioxygenase-like lactoylglutathione lyase family enzyme